MRELIETIEKIKQRQENKELASVFLSHLQTMENNEDVSYEFVESGIRKYQSGNLDQAFDDFDRAVSLFPNADAYYNRGVVFMDKKNLIRGITDFTAAILLYPSYGDAYHNRALCILAIISENNPIRSSEVTNVIEFAKNDLAISVSLGNHQSSVFLKKL